MCHISSDRFLADADWDIVSKYIQVENPYEMFEDEDEVRQTFFAMHIFVLPLDLQSLPAAFNFKKAHR